MSYIAYMGGYAEFADRASFERVRDELDERGFLSMFDTVDDEALILELWFDSYRNLGRNLDRIVEDAVAARFIGTSNDVSWHGFVETHDSSDEYQLDEWAESADEEFDAEPEEEDFDNFSTYADAHSAWQLDIETAFRREFANDQVLSLM